MHRTLALPVTMVAIALGFLISVQLQINAERMTQMKSVLLNSQAQNTKLQQDHRTLLKQLDTARKQVGTDPQLLAQLV